MAIVLTDNKHYNDIADAIRLKNGKTITYYPSEMANAIKAISTSGGNSGSDTDDSHNFCLEIPVIYYAGVKKCMEDFYTGDFKDVMIMHWQGESNATIAVVFLMDDFEILSFDPTTSEFTAIGWYSCYQNQSTGEWETVDWRTQASTGGNYLKNIKFASRYITYNEQTLFPVGIGTSYYPVSATMYSYNGVVLPGLPEYDESERPYIIMTRHTVGSDEGYTYIYLHLLSAQCYYKNVQYGYRMTGSEKVYACYLGDTDKWQEIKDLIYIPDDVVGNTWIYPEYNGEIQSEVEYHEDDMVIAASADILWTNFDILTASGDVKVEAGDAPTPIYE
jgi:hypothetical protein